LNPDKKENLTIFEQTHTMHEELIQSDELNKDGPDNIKDLNYEYID
jgi:hypothetical protein